MGAATDLSLSQTKAPPKVLRTRTYVLFSLLAAGLLVIANSALWFNKYIFNGDNFTRLTTQAIEQESSRTALATAITDKLLEDKPRLKQVIDEPVIKLVSGLLDSNLTQTALAKTVSQLQTILTAEKPENVSFDLSSIKQTLPQVIAVAGNISDRNTEAAELRVEDIPDTITIINADELPNIYRLGVALLWIAPIAALIAVAIFIYLIYRARYSRRLSAAVLATEGSVLIIAGLFALALGPLFKPPILANVPNANMRIIIENIYQTFINTFNSQTQNIFIIGILLIIIALIVLWAKPIATRITRS